MTLLRAKLDTCVLLAFNACFEIEMSEEDMEYYNELSQEDKEDYIRNNGDFYFDDYSIEKFGKIEDIELL